MRTLRLGLAGMVSLMMLAGLGGLALAQSVNEGSGRVTMKEFVMGGGQEAEGTWWRAVEVDASDPRLSGIWTIRGRCQDEPDFSVCVGAVRVENVGGTWLGRVEYFAAPSGEPGWVVLEGQGPYAGLTALQSSSDLLSRRDLETVIFDFEMPEQPEPKLLPAE